MPVNFFIPLDLSPIDLKSPHPHFSKHLAIFLNPIRTIFNFLGIEKPRQGGESTAVASEKPKIFIVDDDVSLLRSIRRLMKSAGYSDVETYGSAEDFLAAAVIETPCLMILDLMLPGMSGISLYQHLRQKGFEIDTVFISAHEKELKRAKAECGEALAFLPKPFNGKDIFAAVRSVNDN